MPLSKGVEVSNSTYIGPDQRISIIYKYTSFFQGDWELRTDKSPVPVKLTVKQFIGSDWMIACMVPKGNMMHCMVRETEEGLKQLKYSITGKEIPVEIMEIETIMSAFFEGEIKDIKREGKILGSKHLLNI